MRTYTFRFYHSDGYLTHRSTRQCVDLRDALQWAQETMGSGYARLEILDGETALWHGTREQACGALRKKSAA